MRAARLRVKRSVPIGAGFVACALALSIARPADAQSGAAECRHTIDGHVVDRSSHEPVAGAAVRMGQEYVALTDADGRFALQAICPGTLTLSIEQVGYETGVRTLEVDGHESFELELEAGTGEVIVVEGERMKPIEMQSTAEITGEDLERTRGRSLAEAVAEVPGVTELRSPSGLSKPVVRGLYGRRLLLLVGGVRHRSQDWGLDHAPEVDPFAAESISVVRGAAGVRYGPDAIGGAILVEPPALLEKPGSAGEVHLIGFQGRGAAAAARLQVASEAVPGLAWQIDGSGKRLASPATPDYVLDNTGVREWNSGGAVGYRTGGDAYELAYRHYQARLGVCSCLRIESSEDFFTQLDAERPIDADLYTSDLRIGRPYQSVAHDLVLGRGAWPLAPGRLRATYALQYDKRQEFDIVRDAVGPQFDFRLTTHDVDISLDHDPIHVSDHHHLRGSVGSASMVQVHRFGGLPLVPDHDAWSSGVYAMERLLGHDFEVEAGVRYEYLSRSAAIDRQDYLRLVRSGQLAMDACSGGEGDPVDCASSFHTVSGSLGGLYQLTAPWAVKLDLSTASRAPNPDEQYLNGTSPSFPVLGLGKPDLGVETTYSASATTTYEGERLAVEASGYANFIDDYIYLAPALDDSGEPIFDVLVRGSFPRFVTRPINAVFYGADGGVSARVLPPVELAAQLSIVRAKNTTDNSFLIFVPPDRARGSIRYELPVPGDLERATVSLGGNYVTRQKRFDIAADLAPPPKAYFLLDAEVEAETRVGERTVELALQGTNLTNARYRDYTSLLRYFADQPGWQVLMRLSVHFAASGSE